MTDSAEQAATPAQPLIDRRLLVTIPQLFAAIDATPDKYVSVRVENCFKNLAAYSDEGVGSLGSTLHFGERHFLDTPQFGKKSLNELKEYLGLLGLSFHHKPQGSDFWVEPIQNNLSLYPMLPKLPDALKDQPPVTPEELQQMLAEPQRDWCVPLAESSAADRQPTELAKTFAAAIEHGHASSEALGITVVDATATPEIDRRLLIKLDDFMAFHSYGGNGGALGRVLHEAGMIYLGDVLSNGVPAKTAPASKTKFVDMLENIGLSLEPSMSAVDWGAVDPASQPPVSRDELQAMHAAEIQRQSEEREAARAAERAAQEAAEAERLQAIQATFTDAQKALLQPQEIIIDDPQVELFRQQIPSGVLEEKELIDGQGRNSKKLTALALAIVTLEGEAPGLIFVKTKAEFGIERVTGLIGEYTEQNRELLKLSWWNDAHSQHPNHPFEQVTTGSQIVGSDKRFFYVREPNALARLGIPTTPKLAGKAKADSAQP